MTIPIVCTRHDEPVVIDPAVEVYENRHSRASGRWKRVAGIDRINFHADGRIRLTCPVCRYDVQISGDGFRVYGVLKHLEGLGETVAPLRVVEAMTVDDRWRPKPSERILARMQEVFRSD